MNIRYQRLGFVEFNVTDLDKSEHFYVDQVGLMAAGRGPGDCRFLRCSDRHHDIVLHRADQAGLKRIGFEMESRAALDMLFDTVQKAGLTPVRLPRDEALASGLRNVVRVLIPLTGVTFDFYEAMVEYGGKPFVPTVAKIQRLGHVVLKTDQHAEAVEFFRDVLNFRISDEVDGAVTFMRCFPNPFHHSFALAAGKRKAHHHVNFMVTEVDDIGRAMWRFQRENIYVVTGPGRHPPSGSMFYYFLDPDGLTVEYSFGMEEFPEDAPRKPRLLPMVPESVDFWGAPRDSVRGFQGEIEQTRENRS